MKPPSKQSQEAIVQYMRAAARIGSQSESMRSSLEYIDREYARENNRHPDHIAARIKAMAGNKKVMADITVPVVFPQTESAWAHLCGVFLSGYPIFATVSSPENVMAADMMDAVNAQHQTRNKWVANLMKSFRDGLKYNVMGVEVDWETKRTYGLQRNDTNGLEAKPIQSAGNMIRRIDMYNAFWDNRVPINEVHERGEFGGYHEIISRIALKQLLADLDPEWKLKNDKAAFEAPIAESFHFVPDINANKFKLDPKRQEFSWENWARGTTNQSGARIQYKDYYEKTVLYARILPEDFDFDVPARNTPQIWKFIIVNSSVCVFAKRLTNAHNYLPTVFGCPYDDGLDYQSKSFAENLVEIQDMSSALWNIRIASGRRNISDRMLYDPRYVRPEDINSSNPSAKIPIRPNQYLDDLRKAVFPFPYNDSASESVIRDSREVVDFGRSISGVSKPSEGQFLKGNRTLGEYNDVRDNGDARMQMAALSIQDNFIGPIKEIIKYNVLQYVETDEIYFSVKKQRVKINPQVLLDAALDFKMSDGILSSSKIADSEFLTMFMQLLPQNQEMMMRYDVVKVVNYLAGLRNVPNLDAFERDMADAPMKNIPGTPENAGAIASAQAAAQPPIPGV